MIQIREPRPQDASNFIRLQQQLAKETAFMLFEPGENQLTLEQQQQHLGECVQHRHQQMFMAEHNQELVGFIAGQGGMAKRNQHSLYIVMGLLRHVWGQGLGTCLLEELIGWAQQHRFHRLELTVMAHNEQALALYRKCGFTEEGIKRHAIFHNDCFIDEFYMSRLLD